MEHNVKAPLARAFVMVVAPILGSGLGLGAGYALGQGSPGELGTSARANAKSTGRACVGSALGANAGKDSSATALGDSSLRGDSTAGREACANAAPHGTESTETASSDSARTQALVEALRLRADAALAAKDRGALLAILADLSKIGKPGFLLAARLIDSIVKMMDSGAPIDEHAFRRVAGTFGTLFEEALEDPSSYGEAFRRFAAGSLPWTDSPDVAALYAKLLPLERDPLVARSMADAMGRSHDPSNVDALVAALSVQANGGVRTAIVGAISATPGDAAALALETLATTGPPDVSGTAANDLLERKPSVSGLLVTYVAPRSPADIAGLAPGDILVSYQGKPFSSWDELMLFQSLTGRSQTVTLALVRQGNRFQALVRGGGQLGLDGRFVDAQVP